MLIVEQNVRQVLKVVDRAYLLEVGRIKASGRRRARRQRRHPQGVHGALRMRSERHPGRRSEAGTQHGAALERGSGPPLRGSGMTERSVMDCQLDIFFLEALLNGLLLAGLLALLALGLNLIFGVIDVVWICYAELVMVGMYGINYAYKGGAPFLLAALFGIVLIALAGALLHYLVIRPVLDTRADQPAARHRRRAVLPAGRRHHGVRHRVQEPRHPARLAQRRRHELLLVAHPGLRGGARRHAGAVAVPHAHLSSAPPSAPSPRTGRSCR